MKHIILSATLFVAICLSANAESKLTKAKNDADIKAGHKIAATKTTSLTADLNSNNTQAAQAAASDLLALMRKAMVQTMNDINLSPSQDRQAINARYLQMEKTVYEFGQLSNNVNSNGQQLIEHAQTFLKLY